MRTIWRGKWTKMDHEPTLTPNALRIQDPNGMTLVILDQGWIHWKDTTNDQWYRTHPDYGETT